MVTINPLGLPEASRPVLSEYQYEPNHSGQGGTAIFDWSDSTSTREPVASESESLAKLRDIQQNGGVKP
jgi:hypothetical protein